MMFRDDLPPQTRWPFVQTMLEHDVVDSTNDVAARIVRAGAPALPVAVWAHRQTRGRGRGGHEWWSDAGSLTFTVALDPAAHALAPLFEPRVALATAVAVIDALWESGFGEAGLGIRWPNDLEFGGRKLGGILPELVELEGGRRLLVGVGLNVRTNLEEAPREIQEMATSLEAQAGRAIENEMVPRLLWAILRHFESTLEQLAMGDPQLADRWNQLDLLRGCEVRVDVGTHEVCGRALGIDALGALCVDEGGTTIQVFGGTVVR